MNTSIESLYKQLKTTREGLNSQEVKKRLERDGKNIFPVGKQKSSFLIFLNQFKSAIIIILFIAIILSLIIGEYANIIFIGAVIIINTIIGFIQEYKAERSAQRLKKHITIMTQVLRANQTIIINSEDLVVGDIVFLDTGSKIPADIRLIEVTNLKVDESILTGESESVVKNIEDVSQNSTSMFSLNMAYAGTIVTMGRAIGVVVNTGHNTEYGKIANKIIEIKSNPSPLTLRINKFTKQISLAFLIISLFLSVILYLKGYDWYNIFFSVVALTVSAIPEGLTTGMTICLSKSSSTMAKKNVVVKQLSAVEGLGSCNIIASDKTGTLTVNEQTAQKIILPNGEDINITGSGYNTKGEILFDKTNTVLKEHVNLITKLGDINNESFVKVKRNELLTGGDSIDIAFKVLALKNKYCEDVNVLSQIPYESELKCSVLHYEQEGMQYVTIKGALSVVLDHCETMLINGKSTKLNREEIEKQNSILAANGFRVIALAYGKHNKILQSNNDINSINNLIFVGMVGFIDPIREDTYAAIKECQSAGINVKMITGDHHLTAFYIGKQLGIVETLEQVATGKDLEKYKSKGKEAFDKYVENIQIFARVTPMQKHAIVESMKGQRNFVSVTGDGVNDVLALKEAHIGITVGSGADVAKETADMIIADDKFSSIATGIEEGKKAYNNVRNIVYLLMSTGICEVILYFLSVLFNLSFPLTGVQFLWLNLVTNGIQSNVFAFEKNELTQYNKKIRKANENIFNRLLLSECIIATIYIGITGFMLYFLLLRFGMDTIMARTYLLTFMVFMESAQAFNCRNEYNSAFKCKFKNNPLLVITILLSFAFQIIALYIAPIAGLMNIVPISMFHVALMTAFSMSQILLMEVFKFILRKRNEKTSLQ